MLGEAYISGDGVPRDMAKARQILEGACSGGYAPACFNLGIMYREGVDTPQDVAVARARFRQGCDLGYQTACQALNGSPSVVR